MIYSGSFGTLNNDKYAPKIPKLSHQHIDNYGIYSIVCLDHRRTGQIQGRDYEFYPVNNNVVLVGTNTINADMVNGDTNLNFCLESFVAYQAFNPTTIPVNFKELIDLTTPTESVSVA